ncbi:SUMO1 sentrin specific peptidase 8 [Homalodisca vitripennis]|nr:SUMO1 sentrin specific peptidase 8 [Homalodisca vitripennis]
MVIHTRSTLAQLSLIEAVLNDATGFDDATECVITRICTQLKRLRVNFPSVDFDELETDFCGLLKKLNDSNILSQTLHSENEHLKLHTGALEKKLQDEKCQRRSELNDSLNAQDSEKDMLIKQLNCNIDELNRKHADLSSLVDTLKNQLKSAEAGTWLMNRWVDDRVLDSYFETFAKAFSDLPCKILFLGPTLVQMVKLGAEDDAKALLSQVSLSSSQYVFCCVSNNVATLKDDSGTHWSLLFVDVAGGAAYHFDSLNQSNNLSAKLTASRLGVEECNFTEISCMQQKNSYECGISVLVNTRLVTEGFCARGPTSQCSFMDWYRNFFAPDFTADEESSDRLSDGSLVLPLLSCASPSKVESLPVNNVNRTVDLSKTQPECKNSQNYESYNLDPSEWNVVKRKRNKTTSHKSQTYCVKKRPGPLCRNRYHVLDGSNNITCENDIRVIKNVSGVWREKPKQKSQSRNSFKRIKRLRANVVTESTEKPASPYACSVMGSNCEHQQLLVSEGCTPERSRGTDRQVGGGTLKNVLVIGDSLLRYAGNLCLKNGATLDINPGAKIEHIKQKLLKYVPNQPKIIYIHVGTNNLVDGYNGRPGYNGGWGKRAALHSMADLLSTAKKHFPISDIMLSSVLTRRDIAPLPLCNFNEQLEVMCINFNVTYVDANRLVRGYHLARDGRHLNRAGNFWFGNFIFRCLHEKKTFPGGCSLVSAVPGDFRAVPEVSQASVQHKESGNGIRGASCFPE